jgi:hypothetical protein
MNIEEPALPEPVSVAIDAAAAKLSNCKTTDVPAILDPLHDALIDAAEDGETVDIDAICAAFPPLPSEIADAAESALDAIIGDVINHTPAMIRFAEARPRRCLAGLRTLSYEAGRGGDALHVWRSQAITALALTMRLGEGPIPPRLSQVLAILEDAFFDGRQVGGIDDDPPRRVTESYLARRAQAREAADERLASASSIDELAAELRHEFALLEGDAIDVVEEATREAALRGRLRAAELRLRRQRDDHRWFADHAADLEAKGRATKWVRSKRGESLYILECIGE